MNALPHDLEETVARAIAEDIQDGDVSAELIPAHHQAHARILCREPAVIAGIAYAEAAFKQIDASIEIEWHVQDGQHVDANTFLCDIRGASRHLLSAERTALNFLQTLSATASTVNRYVQAVSDTQVKLLDTRKTLPGLRLAQKYAVACGGGHNHRVGLFDAFLIKENHIAAAGGITQAVRTARAMRPDLLLEVEVETHQELEEAIAAEPDRIMLDNFSIAEMTDIVAKRQHGIPYEASGNVTMETIKAVAQTGVDFISLGCLTKDIQSIDLSMRFVAE